MPNTVIILKQIIGAMQIMVPVLLIILTAVEIGRIVVAGNLEEELPKHKKSIVVRFVVAVAFFFLPLLINLFLRLMYANGFEVIQISDIDCLFR